MYKEAHKLLENNKEALMLLEKGRRNKFCLWIIDVVLVLVIFLVCFLYLKGELGHGYLLAVAGFVVGLFLMLMLTSINGDRLFDHMRIAMTRDGRFILISQPYLSNEECKEKIIFHDFQNPTRVLGKDKSWYNIGNTNVVLFFEDRFNKQQ